MLICLEFRGHERMATALTTDQLSVLLFQEFVLRDEQKILEKDLGQYALDTISQDVIFRKHVYLYLVSLIAVALTAEFESREIISEVILKFRSLALNEAKTRWDIFEDDQDKSVDEASTFLAKLLFSDPEQARGLSFDWSSEWLNKVLIKQTNPVILFKISTFWKMRFLTLMKSIKLFEIIH